MRTLTVVLVIVTGAIAAEPAAKTWTFGKGDLDKLPAGWTAAKTGEGEGSVWKITADDTAPGKTGHVLTQTAAAPNRLFNLCLANETDFTDGEISVQVRAVKGEIDQGGGLVWRAKDANNYYVCRFNPLEKNFRVYFVQDGKRKELGSKDKIELPADKWFTVAVKHQGNKIHCTLNGEHALEASDDTFPANGKIGLWTKADAVTSFDLLKMTKK